MMPYIFARDLLKNATTFSEDVEVRLVVDTDKQAPYKWDNTSIKTTVPGSSSKKILFYFTPTISQLGAFYRALKVQTYIGSPNDPVVTDTWAWGTAFSVAAPPNKAPTATISSPSNNSSFTQGTWITFKGSGYDPEDKSLPGTSLVWTASPGGNLGTGASVSTKTLSVGTHAITLTVRDSKGKTGSASITITITVPPPPNKAPTATISSPSNNSSFTQGTWITFKGSGYDPEDKSLPGTSLVWTASPGGNLGTGASVSTKTLSVGTHAITLTARDSKGKTGSASITITITAPGPCASNECHINGFVLKMSTLLVRDNTNPDKFSVSGEISIFGENDTTPFIKLTGTFEIITTNGQEQLVATGTRVDILAPTNVTLLDNSNFSLGLRGIAVFSEGGLDSRFEIGKLKVEIQGLKVLLTNGHLDGIEFGGKVLLPKPDSSTLVRGDIQKISITRSGGVKLIGQVAFGGFNIGGLGFKDIVFSFDSTTGIYSGIGKIFIPGMPSLEIKEITIVQGSLKTVSIQLPATGSILNLQLYPQVFLDRIALAVANLTGPSNTPFFCDEVKENFYNTVLCGGVDLRAGPTVDGVALIQAKPLGAAIENTGRLIGRARILVLNGLADLDGKIQVSKTSGVRVGGTLEALGILSVKTTEDFTLDSQGKLKGLLDGTLEIPEDTPVIGWVAHHVLSNPSLSFSAGISNIAVWGTIKLPFINKVSVAYSKTNLCPWKFPFGFENFQGGCNLKELRNLSLSNAQAQSNSQTGIVLNSGLPYVIFRLSWGQGDANLQLVDPNGNVVNQGTAGSNSAIIFGKNPSISEVFYIRPLAKVHIRSSRLQMEAIRLKRKPNRLRRLR